MKSWIIGMLVFLDAGCISNFYWLGGTVNEIFYLPAVTLSIVTLVVGIASAINVLEN